MNAKFDQVKTVMEQVAVKVNRAEQRFPLMARLVQLMLVLVVYASVVYGVSVAAGDIRLPAIAVAMYLLPMLARSWLLFYGELRKDVKQLLRHRPKTSKA